MYLEQYSRNMLHLRILLQLHVVTTTELFPELLRHLYFWRQYSAVNEI